MQKPHWKKECKERWGKTPTALTDALGMYQYGGGGYHCIYMEDQDFEIFRDRGLTAVTNPASILSLPVVLHQSSVTWTKRIALAVNRWTGK